MPDAGESRAGERYGGPASATRPIITLPPGGRGGGRANSPGGPGGRRPFWLVLGLVAVVLIGLAGGYLIVAGTGGSTGSPQAGGAGATPGKPEALTNCTANVVDASGARQALEAAKPGDRICLNGDLGNEELQLRRSGVEKQPITILGGGTATTGQITVRGDHVVVDGVRMNKPRSPGFMLIGNDITVRANVVDSPQVVKKGDDGDGIRFFGNDIKIVNNLVRNVVNLNGQKGNHGDAIQTFATSDENGPSQRVLIDGNRFEEIDNMCLIAEGPDSEAGDGTGEGKSSDFTVTNNYCDNGAGQAFFFDDISDVTLTGNEVVGKIDKAFSLQNDSTGATIRDNKISPKVGYEVGMDDSSEDDYNGPDPEGGP
ncbi:hypothetical protein GCM10023321_10640 [Pseudonocardia eucalypti]|uniref:Periplasmic copper-binding protein NosD beta helix domain-containing protein n=1 Tax=Pseudonocardia eucalypti TaxID=648755 RepID=A0ABP9PR45_9PSEU